MWHVKLLWYMFRVSPQCVLWHVFQLHDCQRNSSHNQCILMFSRQCAIATIYSEQYFMRNFWKVNFLNMIYCTGYTDIYFHHCVLKYAYWDSHYSKRLCRRCYNDMIFTSMHFFMICIPKLGIDVHCCVPLNVILVT